MSLEFVVLLTLCSTVLVCLFFLGWHCLVLRQHAVQIQAVRNEIEYVRNHMLWYPEGMEKKEE